MDLQPGAPHSPLHPGSLQLERLHLGGEVAPGNRVRCLLGLEQRFHGLCTGTDSTGAALSESWDACNSMFIAPFKGVHATVFERFVLLQRRVCVLRESCCCIGGQGAMHFRRLMPRVCEASEPQLCSAVPSHNLSHAESGMHSLTTCSDMSSLCALLRHRCNSCCVQAPASQKPI